MLKIIGFIMIVSGSSLIGYKYSNALFERVKSLKSIRKMLTIFRGEIEFNNATLYECVEVLGERCEDTYKSFYEQLLKLIKENKEDTFAKLWDKVMPKDEKLINSLCLNKQDIKLIRDFGNELGFLDIKMQLSTIENYINSIDIAIKDAENLYKNNSKLYKTVGVLGGILVSILII